MTARTTGRRPAPPVTALLAGLLVAGLALATGVALVLVKWLLVTAALLVVPFAVWWVVDRSRAAASVPAVVLPEPRGAPATTVVPIPRRTSRPSPYAPEPAPAGSGAPRPVAPGRAPRPAPASSPFAPSRPFLAPDRRVTVAQTDDHQDVLARHHRDRPVTRVTAELHPATPAHGAHRGTPAVEVRLDGERVGELTAALSSRYRRLVAATGRPPACLATIAHGERGYEIELRLPKA